MQHLLRSIRHWTKSRGLLPVKLRLPFIFTCGAMLLISLYAAPVSADVAFRSAASAGSASGTATTITANSSAMVFRTTCGSITPAVPAGSVGDLLIAQVVARENSATITMPGWNILFSDNVAGEDYQAILFYRNATGGDPNTITQSGTCNLLMSRITRFGNVDTVQPLEPTVNNSVYSDAGNIDTGTQDTTLPNSMLLIATFNVDNRTVTQPGSFTQLYDDANNNGNTAGFSLNYRIETTVGTKGPFNNMDLSGGGNDPNHGVLFAVRPSTANSLTINVPAGTTSGDVMIASIAVRPSTVPLTAPAGWTLIRSVQQNTGNTQVLTTYYRVADGTEPASYTWYFGASHTGAVGSISSYTGVDTATPIDGENGAATPNSLNHDAPDVTTTIDGGMLVTTHALSSAVTWTPPSGMTEAVDVASQATPNAVGISMEVNYETRPTAGATGTRSATASSDTDVGVTQSVALRSQGRMTAYYTMDEVAWNGSAAEVQDASGSSLHGSAVGGANTSSATPALAGSPGTCRYGVFDGIDDYIQVTNLSSVLNGTASLAFWIRTTQIGSDTGWQAPGVTGVEQSGGADDIFWGWLDATGHIGISVGNDYTTKSVTAINDGAWHHVVLTRDHVAGTYKIYIGGSLDRNGSITGGTIGTAFSSIGRIEDTGGTPMYFNGQLDEVRIYNFVLSDAQAAALMNETHACSLIDHIRLEHGSGASLTCNTATLTIRACADATCSSFYTGGVTGTLTATGPPPTVNWTGGASFTIPAGSSDITKNFQVTTAGTTTLGTSGVTPAPSGTSPVCTFNASCEFTAADTGFIFDVPNHIADVIQNVTISAVRTDDTTQLCVPAFANTTKTVNFWSGYDDPATGTQAVAINSANIIGASPGSPYNLNFDANGQVTLTVQYPDVGQVQINAQHTGSGDAAGLIMNGQDDFITRPQRFVLTISGNPAAADENGGVFTPAGADFTINVEARNAGDTVTPNYGKETTPETVVLTKTLVLPVGGNNPGLTGNFGDFGDDCNGNANAALNGTACGTFSWPEVGIISLTPAVGDGDYLGTGNVTGTASGNIGRFIPNHFTLTNGTLTSRIAAGCAPASTFTYMDENLELGFQLTAYAADGTTVTQNYEGVFAKLIPTLPLDLNFGAVDTAGPTALTARISTGVITAGIGWNNGVVDIIAPVAITRAAAPDGPYQNLLFGVAPVDSDTVALSSYNLDTDNNAVNDRGRINNIATPADVRYGRLFMESAFGSELLPLALPLYAEYYSGTQFVLNTDDSCTTYDSTNITLTNRSWAGSDPTPSGSGTLSNGRGNAITLSAPGAGVNGSIDAILNVPAYLHYDWDNDTNHDNDPRSKATFGIFGGPEDNQIYIREVY